MQKFIRLTLALVTVSSSLLLTGCGSGPAVNAQISGTAVPAEIRLGYFANITHAQAVIGIARGDYQKAVGNIPIKPLVFNAGPAAIEALNAGALDFTYIGPGPAITAHVTGKGNLARVVAGSATNGVAIVVRKDSGIKKLEDLKGKRIATPQYGNTQDIAARAFVLNRLKDKTKNDGGTTAIEPTPNAEQIGLFKQNQLDAAWAPEPWATRLIHETGATLLEEEKNLWDDKRFTITVVVVSKRFLEKYPAQVEALLKAHVELTDFVNKSPDQAQLLLNAELNKLTGKSIAPDILKEAMSRTGFTTEPLEASFDRYAEWTHDIGLSKDKADLKGLFELSILKKVQGK